MSGEIVSEDWGGWASREVGFDAGEAGSCCARYNFVDVNARLVSACLADRRIASSLFKWRGFEVSRRGLEKSWGRRRGLPLRGSAVVKLKEKVREVLDICKDQEAL